MNRTLIAVDPGASGGIAFHSFDAQNTACFGMPETEGDVLNELKILATGDTPVCYIEELTGYAGIKIPSHTMFKLGRNVGFLHGALQSLGFRIETVTPQAWQKELGLGSKGGLKKHEWKAKLKAKAQQLYPHLKVTLQTADALLMLEYAKRRAAV